MVTLAPVILAHGVSANVSIGHIKDEATFQKILSPVIPTKCQKLGETLQFGIWIMKRIV